MKHARKWLALALAGALSLSLLAGCAGNTSDTPDDSSNAEQTQSTSSQADSDALVIADQGIFSASGTVTQSDGTFDVANYYTSRAGSTSHVGSRQCALSDPRRMPPAFPWCSSTATANPAWAG